MQHPRLRPLLLAALLAGVTGCGSPSVDPAVLLRDGKKSIDSASAVHFTLSSDNVIGGGPLITGGQGDAQRPAGFSGRLDVLVAGFAVKVDVVSVGGTFYAKTPLLGPTYQKADPASYGFGDPAKLLDPSAGLSSLLTDCSGAATQDSDRVNGEQLDEVSCAIPGTRVAALLTSADPSRPVQATIGVTPDSHQVRRVVLVGPFFSKSQDSTYTVVLANYGEKVSVTPPAR